MRRLPVLVSLLAMLLLVAPAAALADEPGAAAPDPIVLAAESEPVGPEPAPRDAEDNAARELGGYEDRDLPFTWGAAWILTFAGLAGLVLFAGLYQLMVRGPAQKSAQKNQS